jgi:phenylpropionate dioxygenase-like ring-hydroxylating dioxygenase large terminal subunit
MNPLITPQSYFSEDIFKKEISQIFGNQWIFAGFLRNLKNDNDFITLEVGTQSIVVQNFKGKIKSFLNVCTHRFSKIQCEKQGNRSMTCPYHGWSYNAEGLPFGIPKKPNFGEMTKEDLQSLSLKKFDVEICGEFIFIKNASSENTVSLNEYLGDTKDILLKVSDSLGKEIDCNELEIDANWKIAVENTLEAYHISSVHPTTFKPIFGEQKVIASKGDHSYIEVDLETGFDKIQNIYSSKPFALNGYLHVFVFPNLTIASSYGASFSIQQFIPLSQGKTKFVSYVFQTILDENLLSKRDQIIVSSMNDSIVEFNRTVFSEDKYICEQVQKGAQMTSQAGILSVDEIRVLDFHKAYNKHLS